jgi:Xaa-Pro aminopeptidase
MTIKELNDIVIDVYSEELKRVGLISEDSEIPNYYYHGVSHSLGMDTHDVFDRNIPLEEGMVITVEPGIYIEKYGLGIRIEDDILITKKGCEVLTDIVKEPDQIEEMMDIWEVK